LDSHFCHFRQIVIREEEIFVVFFNHLIQLGPGFSRPTAGSGNRQPSVINTTSSVITPFLIFLFREYVDFLPKYIKY
jgi:hypothetical protein